MWTERIRVRSVVGRFLEHTRVLYFRWGSGDDDEALYLSSADWMGRNMFRRIEVAWPVHDVALRQRVIDECLVPYLHDACDAWLQASDGGYSRVGASAGTNARPGPQRPGGPGHALHDGFHLKSCPMDLILWRHAEARDLPDDAPFDAAADLRAAAHAARQQAGAAHGRVAEPLPA